MIATSRRLSLLLFLGLLLLSIDAATKWWTHHYLPMMHQSHPHYPYGGVAVFRNVFGIQFSLSHTINTGAAWGVFAAYPSILTSVRLLLLLGLCGYYFSASLSYASAVALVFVISGALGNLLDIAFYGHVVDMFNFFLWGYDFPVFNVADITIFCGVCWLALFATFHEKEAT